ncbi:DUF1499 domain-containing protein [Jiella endophytica]|nr:DUF1499 domain-containing protein [Jiella endophytica]
MSRVSRYHPRRRSIAVGVLGVTAVVAGGFVIAGPKRVWEWIGGPADQGPVDFDHLVRRRVPNDALACSKGTCRQRVDFELPHFDAAPQLIMARFDPVVIAMGQGKRVDDGRDETYRRYVFRSRVLEFPDTLDARATIAGDGRTALKLYSRSLLGRGDFGANRQRLRRIAADLERTSGPNRQIGRAPAAAALR